MTEAELAAVEAEWEADRYRPRTTFHGPGVPSALVPSEAKWRYAAVVGESFRNLDGQSRQDIIRQRVRPGDAAELVPDPDNARDSQAVRVCLCDGTQIGYLDRDWATDFQWERLNGCRHAAVIHRIYGGSPDKPSLGVVLRVVSTPPGTTDAEVAAVVERARRDPDEWDESGPPGDRKVELVLRVELGAPASDPISVQAEESLAPARIQWRAQPTEPSRHRGLWITLGLGLGLAAALGVALYLGFAR